MTDQVLDLSGQLTAAIENQDGTANIYLTANPAANALTLTLVNGLSGPVVFPPGTPVAYEDLPVGQSAVYLYLNGLIDNKDIAGIALSAPGWAAGTFTGSDSLQYLVIAPVSTVTVPPGGPLAFKLDNVLVKGSARSGTADVDLAGATGATPLQSDVPLFINITSPPQQGDAVLPVQIGFRAPDVYTGQPQSLTLYLVNTGASPLVPGKDSWHSVPPTFQLTLVYGDGTGALTTVAQAAQLAMEISDSYGNLWKVPQREVQGQRPYWMLQPDPNGGGTVLGAGEQATIEFTLTGIDATLPAGLDAAITLAHVSWHDIPGYANGVTPVIITKRAGPKVTSFSADPSFAPLNQSSVQTVLTWDTAHATGVWFDAPGLGRAQPFRPSGSGPTAGGIDIPRDTTVTVIAYKDISPARPTGAGGPAQTSDDVITATRSLRISGLTRTDLSPGVNNLGDIVIPPGSARAFVFQMNTGISFAMPVTKALVLDLATGVITATVDITGLVPSQFDDPMIEAAWPSPDGKTIHVIASSGAGGTQYYLLPLNVASATYGKPVSVGTLPWDPAISKRLLATPDGRTLYVTGFDDNGNTLVYAFDPGTYALKGSWTWQPEVLLAAPAASNADGSLLLMTGLDGLTVVDVAGGFVPTASLTSLPLGLFFVRRPVVSPDNSRAYVLAVDNVQGPANGHLLTIDVDLAAGSLRLAKDIPLGLIPQYDCAVALSPDARTLYAVTGADTLTAYHSSTYAAEPYQCGLNNDFMPLKIVSGPQPKVLYCVGYNGDTAATVSIITLP